MTYWIILFVIYFVRLCDCFVYENGAFGLMEDMNRPEDVHLIAMSIYNHGSSDEGTMLLITNNLYYSIDRVFEYIHPESDRKPHYKIKLSTFQPFAKDVQNRELYRSLCYPKKKCQKTENSIVLTEQNTLIVLQKKSADSLYAHVFNIQLQNGRFIFDKTMILKRRLGIPLSKSAPYDLSPKGFLLHQFADGSLAISDKDEEEDLGINFEKHFANTPPGWAIYIGHKQIIFLYDEKAMHFRIYQASELNHETTVINNQPFHVLNHRYQIYSSLKPRDLFNFVNDKLDMNSLFFSAIGLPQDCIPNDRCVSESSMGFVQIAQHNASSIRSENVFIMVIILLFLVFCIVFALLRWLTCPRSFRRSSSKKAQKTERNCSSGEKQSESLSLPKSNEMIKTSPGEIKSTGTEIKSVSKTVSFRHWGLKSKVSSKDSDKNGQSSRDILIYKVRYKIPSEKMTFRAGEQ